MPTRRVAPRRGSIRPGRTEKISVSLNRSDLSLLQKRAKRLYGGNLSAAITEGVQRVREEEGREALVAWLGEIAKTTPTQRDAVRAEWLGTLATPRRRGRVA